jgi:hypothetical protein
MTERDQRVWDGIYAAAYAHLSVIGHKSNEINAGNAHNIADLGLALLQDCQDCNGVGRLNPFGRMEYVHTSESQECPTCLGTGRKP